MSNKNAKRKKQQDIQSMFRSMKERNKKKSTWTNRQPGILSSPKHNHIHKKRKLLDCNNKPIVSCDIKFETQPVKIKKKSSGKKRKYHMISSANDNNTIYNNPYNPNKKRKLSINNDYEINSDFSNLSNSKLFNSLNDDQTPMKLNIFGHKITEFRRDRLLNPINPIDISDTSNGTNNSNSNLFKDNIIELDIDPKRLSIDPDTAYNNRSTCNTSNDNNNNNNNDKLTSLLDSLLNDTNLCDPDNNNDECNEKYDYFDDDLDENELISALNNIDQFDNNDKQQNKIINEMYINNTNNTNNKHADDRYYRFKVTEIIDDQYMRCKTIKVVNLRIKEKNNNKFNENPEYEIKDKEEYDDEDIDIISDKENEDWTIEIRQDWYSSIIQTGDIIHVIGETVYSMKQLFIQKEKQYLNNNNNNIQYPLYLIPNENIPIIIDDKYHIIIDNLHNYLIIHPDCLIVPSRIGASYPCPRRQVLNHNIRISEENHFLLYGIMGHELFQMTLQRGIINDTYLKQDINHLISKYIINLYSIEETEESAQQRLSAFIPNMKQFCANYMNTNTNTNNNNNFNQYQYQNNRNNMVDWGVGSEKVSISSVIDIEENIWSPMYGIQGKIDATLQTSSKLLPFELKTGKQSGQSVLQARAQLCMYSLMLADRYDTPIDGGLLYYLKTGNLMGIPLPHNEIRALLMRRNELAKYFNSYPILDKHNSNNNNNNNDSDNDRSIKIHKKQKRKQKEFPSILLKSQLRECTHCFQKNECFIYHKVHNYNNNDIIDNNNNNNNNNNDNKTVSCTNLYNSITSFLNNNHLEYISKWFELIDLEETYCLGSRHEIWSMNSVKREKKTGKCLANMIIFKYKESEFKHIYTFKKHPDYITYDNNNNKYNNKTDIIKLWDLKFRINGYVIISSEDGKYGLGSGKIIELNTKYIVFASRVPIKNLSAFNQHRQVKQQQQQIYDNNCLYRIDIDDSAYGFNTLRGNILYYFLNNDNEIINKKRKLLIDLCEPKFNSINNIINQLKIPIYLQNDYNLLNIDQQNAVLHVLASCDYSLILGMPGTGKSSTIIFLIRLLVSFNYKIMLTAYTNSAIDHICLKLIKYADIQNKLIRIGNSLSINKKLSNYVLEFNNNNCNNSNNKSNCFSTIKSCSNFILNKYIFAVTSISSTSHPILSSILIDYCIVDEAGQLTEPQILGPLRKCNKFVLVGDNNQLPPLVQCKEAKNKGMNVSLFEKLLKKYKKSVKSLTIQYRMNKNILKLPNNLIYNNCMKCANDIVSNQQIILNKNDKNELKLMTNNKLWLYHAINPDQNVLLLNTDPLYNNLNINNNNNNNLNENEANIIEIITNLFFDLGIYSSQIGVMAPYRSQLKLIKSKLDKLNVPLSPSSQTDINNNNTSSNQSSLLLDTIDRFQGSDRDIIIIGFTHKATDKKIGSILYDWRRINVALTRAKCKLILIASINSLKNSKSNILNKIVNISRKQKWIVDVDKI